MTAKATLIYKGSGAAKACWGDNTLLPGTCVIDEGERWNCVHAQEYNSRFDCEHWNEVLSLELAQEILGDGYKIERVADINEELYRWGL